MRIRAYDSVGITVLRSLFDFKGGGEVCIKSFPGGGFRRLALSPIVAKARKSIAKDRSRPLSSLRSRTLFFDGNQNFITQFLTLAVMF